MRQDRPALSMADVTVSCTLPAVALILSEAAGAAGASDLRPWPSSIPCQATSYSAFPILQSQRHSVLCLTAFPYTLQALHLLHHGAQHMQQGGGAQNEMP